MEILGSIDCASRAGAIDGQALYHLIFTEESIIAARVLVRKDELKKVEGEIKARTSGAVTWTVNSMAKAAQMRFFEDAMSRGKEIEKDLDNYVASDPAGLDVIDYSRITKVEVSKGTMFGLPYIRLLLANREVRFNPIRNIFEKAGKLDDELFKQYRDTLKKAFGTKMRIKI